ncbi:MAG: hypothetical protein JWR65_2702 [Massilia sp.]|nr:hypothetical protein [Massilia sp.]
MRQHPFSRLARCGSAFALSGVLTCLPTPAQAVELGDTLVRSHLGQPLSADIELTGIVNDAATVQAGLADAEVYRGANVAIHPAVAALNIAIIRREGKRFLHLTSPKPVDAEFVHIFFELNENGRRAVRQTTLWFTPDPHPAPPKPAPAPPAVAPAPAATVAPAPPAKPPLPPQVAAPVAIAPVRPMPALAAPTARPAACIPQFTAAQLGTCAALDAKNAALSAQIVELEEKVKRLTVAMHAGAVTAAPAPPARAVPKAPPEQLAPMGAPARKPAGATPWLFIGLASAVVFALVGVLVYLLRRKRKSAGPTPAVRVSPGFMAGVRDRILPGRKPTETPPPVEPTAG